MIEIGFMVAIIMLASTFHKYMTGRSKGLKNNVQEQLFERIDELERRITDVQDVMISIDERLKRE